MSKPLCRFLSVPISSPGSWQQRSATFEHDDGDVLCAGWQRQPPRVHAVILPHQHPGKPSSWGHPHRPGLWPRSRRKWHHSLLHSWWEDQTLFCISSNLKVLPVLHAVIQWIQGYYCNDATVATSPLLAPIKWQLSQFTEQVSWVLMQSEQLL